jgi:hypothetical protein
MKRVTEYDYPWDWSIAATAADSHVNRIVAPTTSDYVRARVASAIRQSVSVPVRDWVELPLHAQVVRILET